MNFKAGLGALALPFFLATGATAQQHPLVIDRPVDEIRDLMRDRFPEGTRIFTTTGSGADADDVNYSWELQTSLVDQVSTCADDVGVEQLRIIVLSTHDLGEDEFGALHNTQRASEIFRGYWESNMFSDVPMEAKPDEMTEEAWYHAFKMGEAADLIENQTGITATIFTVQIPTDQIPGVDMQCNVPMSDEMREQFGLPTPDGNDPGVIVPPDMGGDNPMLTPQQP